MFPGARQEFVGPASSNPNVVNQDLNHIVTDTRSGSNAGYNMIDDDEKIVLDTGSKIHCPYLQGGQVVYFRCVRRVSIKSEGKTAKWVVSGGDWFGECRHYPAFIRSGGALLLQQCPSDRGHSVRVAVRFCA
ncbi:hypothetical protein V1525DRAFT_259230 [Lipomyces kononenkoae]|uniref:Uncharacterized protein n=1 Tax=Lipomyces kononenkoae TaxID=34357 RepID=A0ACC3SV65_LIPKO